MIGPARPRCHLLAPEVLVKGAEFAVVRPRETYEAMLGRERPAPFENPIIVATFNDTNKGSDAASALTTGKPRLRSAAPMIINRSVSADWLGGAALCRIASQMT